MESDHKQVFVVVVAKGLGKVIKRHHAVGNWASE
jgi:hypothetical protein